MVLQSDTVCTVSVCSQVLCVTCVARVWEMVGFVSKLSELSYQGTAMPLLHPALPPRTYPRLRSMLAHVRKGM